MKYKIIILITALVLVVGCESYVHGEDVVIECDDLECFRLAANHDCSHAFYKEVTQGEEDFFGMKIEDHFVYTIKGNEDENRCTFNVLYEDYEIIYPDFDEMLEENKDDIRNRGEAMGLSEEEIESEIKEITEDFPEIYDELYGEMEGVYKSGLDEAKGVQVNCSIDKNDIDQLFDSWDEEFIDQNFLYESLECDS